MALAVARGTLHPMPPRWRWGLAITIVATGLGVFMPNALLSGGAAVERAVAPVAHQLPSDPAACVETSCNKGAPTPATPPLAMGALWAACTVVIACAVARVTRRRSRSTAN